MPAAYRILRLNDYRHGRYRLLPIRPDDREDIRQWRNAQLDVLRQSAPLTAEAQDRYFHDVVAPLFEAEQPGQLLFSLLLDEELIGYGGLVHIDWLAGRAEISFLLETGRNAHIPTFQADFAAYLHLLRQVAFEDLNLQKINTEAYDVRPYLTEVLAAEGFAEEARLPRHVQVAGQLVDTVFHSCFRPTGAFRGHVLITSLAGKAPLLRAVQAAARRLHYATKVIGADLNPQALARPLADDFWLMPPLRDELLPELLAGLQARGIAYLIPTRDGELAFWSRHRAALAAAGVAVLVSAPEAVHRCLDKLEFTAFGLQHGLPIIATARDIDSLTERQSQPPTAFVVKERHGAGSLSLGLNLPAAAALAHARTLQEPVFQPFIHGREISVDGYVDRTGRVHGLVARIRDVVVRGESQVTTTLLDAALLARLTPIVEKLGLYGPFVLQALLTEDDGLHLIECNCRFGGASTLGIAAGVDSFYWFLQESGGNDLQAFPFVPAAIPLRQVRVASDNVFVVGGN
ncbi:ATP-grasp domain-containing protein [Hymenobacter sp. DH14]|uniref:ATP-grasp domain-containing protein n=1 Tax=Hymenobacter cyanobacteriorum TaxID=2926463 RepID=A0A9X1VC21_9BACT|nr:GNAT family N-acetyltransferase [Hymenobacter cyanobacteriorum]MCI1185922.1 ATP-grasp domain-containing protein [Hymenobacter cyanobacteriorum]